MNKKEIAELKRRIKKDSASFSRMVGCYVDGNRHKVCTFNGSFLGLEEDEYFKYLEIAGKVLSGTPGNNLLTLAFPLEEEAVGGRQQILMALRDSELKDENLLNAYYDLIIDTYDQAGNYLILLYLDSYDVMKRTTDSIDLDESEEVYTYLLCAICPVDLSKPGLGYLEKEQRFGPRIRDWVVGAPDTGFLFPAFTDRSTDIHSCLFYTKNTKEPHTEFMTNGLGCGAERTATEQKMAFHSIVKNALGPENEDTIDTMMDLQTALKEMIMVYEETHDEEDGPMIIDAATLGQAMEECEIPPEKQDRITRSLEEAFGDKIPAAENVIDKKALAANEVRTEKLMLESEIGTLTLQLAEKKDELQERETELVEKKAELVEKQAEIDTYRAEVKNFDVVLHVKPEKAPAILTQVIDGKRYLLIPVEEDETISINGVGK